MPTLISNEIDRKSLRPHESLEGPQAKTPSFKPSIRYKKERTGSPIGIRSLCQGARRRARERVRQHSLLLIRREAKPEVILGSNLHFQRKLSAGQGHLRNAPAEFEILCYYIHNLALADRELSPISL